MGDSIDDDIIPFIKTKTPYTPVPLIYDNIDVPHYTLNSKYFN